MAIAEVTIGGSPYERGIQFGRHCREQITVLLADNFARVNAIRRNPLAEFEIWDSVHAHTKYIEAQVPNLAQELAGLAEGARITYREAILLQTRRELIGASEHGANVGDCTLVAFWREPEDALIAQTIDLNGSFRDFGLMLRVLPQSSEEPEILMFTFAGLLGYVGMNSAGLAVGINLVLSGGWRAGIPPYLLVRHMLERTSVEECICSLRALARSSSRSFTIADRARLVNVECTVDRDAITELNFLYHTNHFLHPELAPLDTMNVFSKNNSRKRLQLIGEAFTIAGCPTVPEGVLNSFCNHAMAPFGVCAHANGDARRGETVASVVMLPKSGCMYVRPGLPCETQVIQTFHLRHTR